MTGPGQEQEAALTTGLAAAKDRIRRTFEVEPLRIDDASQAPGVREALDQLRRLAAQESEHVVSSWMVEFAAELVAFAAIDSVMNGRGPVAASAVGRIWDWIKDLFDPSDFRR